jgi:hypothetical protein
VKLPEFRLIRPTNLQEKGTHGTKEEFQRRLNKGPMTGALVSGSNLRQRRSCSLINNIIGWLGSETNVDRMILLNVFEITEMSSIIHTL